MPTGAKEDRSNIQARNTCSWILERGDEPKRHPGATIEERRAAQWLSYNRRKKRTGPGEVYGSDLEILASFGLDGLLDSTYRELCSNAATVRICKEIVTSGREPAIGSPDGEWLKRKRLQRSQVYKSDQELAALHGLPNIFSRVPQEMRSNINAHMTCKWVLEKGLEPSAHATSEHERYLGAWLVNKRQSAKGNSSAKLYVSDDEIMDSYGLSNLLDSR